MTAPLALLNVIVHWRSPQRLQVLLVALGGIGLVSAHVLFVNLASYRYLHPLPFFLIANTLPVAVSLVRDPWRSFDP